MVMEKRICTTATKKHFLSYECQKITLFVASKGTEGKSRLVCTELDYCSTSAHCLMLQFAVVRGMFPEMKHDFWLWNPCEAEKE